MRKFLVISLFLAITATSVGAYLAANTGAGKSLTASASREQISAEISNCTGDQWTNFRIYNDTVVECITYKVLRPQVQNGNITNLNLALEDVVIAHREFWLPCHNFMHKAADSAADTPSGILAIIKKIDLPACQGGLVHGLIDAFARVSPTIEDFRSLADTCTMFNERAEAQSKPQSAEDFRRLYAYCTDGAGHAAWEHAHDLNSAVDACNAINEPTGQALCAEGVLMQIYEPANGEAEKSVDQGFLEIPDLCANWPDKSAGSPTLIGCNTGAAYVYSRPAWHTASLLISNAENNNSTITSESLLEKAEGQIMKAIDMCSKYHTNDCLRSLANQVPDILYTNQSTINSICAAIKADEDMCLQAKESRAGKK